VVRLTRFAAATVPTVQILTRSREGCCGSRKSTDANILATARTSPTPDATEGHAAAILYDTGNSRRPLHHPSPP